MFSRVLNSVAGNVEVSAKSLDCPDEICWEISVLDFN